MNEEQILAIYEKVKKDPNVIKELSLAKKITEYTRNRELVKLSSIKYCPLIEDINEHSHQLDGKTLKNLVFTKPYDPKVMELSTCVTQAVIYLSPLDDGSLKLNEKIRHNILNLRQIGDPSSFGFALLADLRQAKRLYVVKAPQPGEDGLEHELVIGIFGTNSLRREIPNFAYLYGGFKCSPPLLDAATGKVISYCGLPNGTDSVFYIIYEAIPDSKTVSAHIHTFNIYEFLNIFMQLVYSLRLAYKRMEFTHYDLHDKNVVVRKVDPTILIPYETENGIEYIATRNIATIIDYGKSHIFVDGEHYGYPKGKLDFTYPNRGSPIHDLYKFFMFCFFVAARVNTPLYNLLIPIFRYFNPTDDPQKVVTSQRNYNFFHPPFPFDYDDFARYIRKNYNCSYFITTKKEHPVYNCESGCFNEIPLNMNTEIVVPNDIVDFYYLIMRFQNGDDQENKLRFSKEFATIYPNAMKTLITQLDEMHDKIKIMSGKVETIDMIRNIMLSNFLEVGLAQIIIDHYMALAHLLNLILSHRLQSDVAILVANYYKDKATNNILRKKEKDIDSYVAKFKVDVEELVDVNKMFNYRLNGIPKAYKRLPKIHWYWDGKPAFDSTFSYIASKPNL